MSELPLTTGSAITNYIQDVKNQIKLGLGGDASLAGPIELEMSTTLEKSKSGGFMISVLQAGAKVNHREIHKINIPIKLNSKLDEFELEAKIADAMLQKELSDKKVSHLQRGTHPNNILR